MAEDSRKMRLVGSFDEYGYRPGLAGSLAQGLFRAAQPTRYPRSVGERLIGGVFDGLATHRNMRIQDDLAIAEREKREIEMEELRRTANINRQLEDLRMNYMSGDYLGRPMSTSDFIRQGAMLRGDPKTLLDLATLEKTTFDLDSSTVNKLLDMGATFEDINNYQRTGTATPALQNLMVTEREETRETRDLEQEAKKDEQYYTAIQKYSDIDDKWEKHDTNIRDAKFRKNLMINDISRFTAEDGEYRKLLEEMTGVGRDVQLKNLADEQKKTDLIALISDLESRIGFQNLKQLKAAGVTLGALSEQEFANLAKELGSFNTDMSVRVLIDQLTRIQERVTGLFNEAIRSEKSKRKRVANTARIFGDRANKLIDKRGGEIYDLSKYSGDVATGDEQGGLED
jgi:hypothetical protein